MTMTDPVVDMLIHLRNASSACHESMSMPYSKMRAAIASILQTEGYIKSCQVEEAWTDRTLVLNLKYDTKHERTVSGVKCVSKPSLRVYAKSSELPRIMDGFGVAIISSSPGLFADREAADKGVGGEAITYIW